MKKNESKWLVIIAIGVFLLFALLIVQFYKIQVLEFAKWDRVAMSQHEKMVPIQFKRGSFFANTSLKLGQEKQALVQDVVKFHLHIDPKAIPQKFHDEIASNLTSLAEQPVEKHEFFMREMKRKSRNRSLVKWMDDLIKKRVLNWWYPYCRKNKIAHNALFFIKDYKRSYPFGKLLGQVLHTVRDIKDEKTRESIPTGGLELYFNDYLKGKLGKCKMARSMRHILATDKVISPAEDGADLFLTIDHYLQAIAEEELEKGIKKAQAKGGWAIMMEPNTGEILAFAQYPFFYPGKYQEYYNDEDLLEHTSAKAVNYSFEPGSIMKPITLAITLNANNAMEEMGENTIFSTEAKMPTSNSHFRGRKKPLKDTTFHRFLNLDMAMQKSSNIYLARLVEKIIDKLGNDWYREQLVNIFSMGIKTNIELPGESPGLVPTPGKKHPNGTLEWSLPTPYSLAIGHNIQLNSLQLLRAYGIFANGGYLVQPTLVRKIIRGDNVLQDNTDRNNFPRVLSQDIVKRIVHSMKFITHYGGTSRRANIPGYTETGKTGTAEKVVGGVYSKKDYFSSFVGFTPVDNPKFVLLVSIDEPRYFVLPDGGKNHHGGRSAAPVFREISRRSLEYLGVPKDDPSNNKWRPELAKLRNLYNEWNK